MSKQEQVKEIEKLLKPFCSTFLDSETTGFVWELLNRLARKRKLDLGRGRKEIWAAAIVYVIARLNFLFDPEGARPLTPALVCDFFRTKKRTVANKATQIERGLGIETAEPGLCRQEIVDAFSVVELPGGFVLPGDLAGREIVIEFLEDEEAAELEERIAEMERQREREAEEKRARRAELKRQAAAEKKKAISRIQPSLFDS